MKIDNCYFCGEKCHMQEVVPFHGGPRLWCVACEVCGASGPLRDVKGDAVASWNELRHERERIARELESFPHMCPASGDLWVFDAISIACKFTTDEAIEFSKKLMKEKADKEG